MTYRSLDEDVFDYNGKINTTCELRLALGNSSDSEIAACVVVVAVFGITNGHLNFFKCSEV